MQLYRSCAEFHLSAFRAELLCLSVSEGIDTMVSNGAAATQAGSVKCEPK